MRVFPLRTLGGSELRVTPLGMGCWPITGITSIDVHEAASRATLRAAYEAGINFYDTAYCYGYAGESERMIGEELGRVRDQIVVASKGGIHWGSDRQQVRDGRPETLRRQCEESLRRLRMDVIDLYYLHAPDPAVPVEVSATAFCRLLEEGKIRAVGLSNASVEQLQAFHRVCPLTAYQPHYNMLQREIEQAQLPWCVSVGVAVVVYWPLMKGLLAGQLSREHVFDPRDGRQKYPMFQGTEWQKNQDFLDRLRPLAHARGVSVAQLVLNWTIQRAGITVALCGAKRPEQIRDNAAAMQWQLTPAEIADIDRAIAERGPIVSRAAVS
ncbi:MAG: general stress protein [Planctomycetaceae bacterium]|nr:MAG: general stress protein [Planctomycetaceae bacterium]